MYRYLALLMAGLFYFSTLVQAAEVRKLGVNDLSYTDFTSPGGKDVIGLQPVDVRVYGTALTSTTVQSAINAASNGATIVMPNSTYAFSSTVNVNKSITLILMGTKITGPGSGYVFNVTVNDVSIIGYGDSKITLSTGGTGGIHNNQAMRTRYRDFKIDMNDVENATGFFHDGGWYVTVENVEIEKAQTAASSDGIRILSTYTGVPGDTGSYGGAYVGNYSNVVARTLNINPVLPARVTTMTFTNLDAESVTINNALSMTFLQPVIQTDSGGSFFTLDNVTGFTSIGGDYEGSGTVVYTLSGSINGMYALNNQVWNADNAAAYISGDISIDDGYFYDRIPSGQVTGGFHGSLGSLQYQSWKNTGYDTLARMGYPYIGNEFTLSNNGIKTSDTTATLDNTSVGASFLTFDTSGRTRIQYASPSANPAAVDNSAMFDNGGAVINVAYTYENNASAVAGGLTVGRLYKTSSGQLMIVY